MPTLDWIGGMNGEEEACAKIIDDHAAVVQWVRNEERRPYHSFWLQTSTDRFYPDFVCQLRDDRVLAVEYKGADRWSNDDSKEKRAVGAFWEAKSSGACLFVMPEGTGWDALEAKLA